MPINAGAFNQDKDFYYTEEYKVLVRSQKELLLQRSLSVVVDNPNILYAFRNDFYRYLRVRGIEEHLFWTIAYLNGIENPHEDVAHLKSFQTVDESDINRLIARTNTVRG